MILECYDILKLIQQRPGMRTGDSTLKAIYTYLSGYYQALVDNNLNWKNDYDSSFHDWIANRLGYYESTAGWANMILAYSINTNPKNISWEKFFITPITHEQHLESIKLFYKLVEDFKKANK